MPNVSTTTLKFAYWADIGRKSATLPPTGRCGRCASHTFSVTRPLQWGNRSRSPHNNPHRLHILRPAGRVRALPYEIPLGDHLQRDLGERRARVGQRLDDLEVVHVCAYVRRRLPLFGKFSRLARELRALLFRPGDRHRAADAIGVPDRAVFVLEALVQPHVDIARAEPYWQQVLDHGNKQSPFYNTDFCEGAGCQMRAGGMPAQE